MSLSAQKSLTSLPVEILAIIVRMARDQDLHLKERLARSRERVATATREVMWLSKWYGRSLLALHATCKTLEGLAKPFVFESIKFSKSSEDLFLDHVLPNYAYLIREVVFDECPSTSEYAVAFQAFLMAMRDTSSLKSLIFKTQKALAELCKTYTSSQNVSTASNATQRAFRPLFASLGKRVTRLTCLETDCSQMTLMTQIFPSLKYLKRRLEDVDETTDGGAERVAYDRLVALEELDLSSMDQFNDLNINSLSEEPSRCSWDEMWASQSWHTVSTLNFSTMSLTMDDWSLLKSFRFSLKILKLKSFGLRKSLDDQKEECTAWPNLTTLFVVGYQPLVNFLLIRLKMAPLVTINIKLTNEPTSAAFALVVGPQKQWSEFLKPFAATLRRLTIDGQTIPYAANRLRKIRKHCLDHQVVFDTDRGNEETACFVGEDQKLNTINWEEHPGRDKRGYAYIRVTEEVEEVLSYIKRCLHDSVRLEDRKEVYRLASLLRGVAAKKLMEDD